MGIYHTPPPRFIGGAQPYAPKLGLPQSGPTPQAPPLRGPMQLVALYTLVASWQPKPFYVQGAGTLAPNIQAVVVTPPPLKSFRYEIIRAAWNATQPAMLVELESSATIGAPDQPPASSAVNLSTVIASWRPPIFPSQGSADFAPTLPPPIPPIPSTNARLHALLVSWIPPWSGPGQVRIAPLVPAQAAPSQPQPLSSATLYGILGAWAPSWYGPRQVRVAAFIPPAAVPDAPPVRTHVNLRLTIQQWEPIHRRIQKTTIASFLPVVVTPEVYYEVVPYLIGALEASARFMLTQIHLVPNVIGSGGSVVSQDIEPFTLVPRGTVVTITMGGPVNNPPRNPRGRGWPNYNSRLQ